MSADDVASGGNDPTDVLSAREARDRFAGRLRDVGVRARRFIPVRDGEKGTRMPGHQQPENWLDADDPKLAGNYGVHPGQRLIEFDCDDYDDVHDTDALDALPDTFTVKSPHTREDSPGHRYYAIAEGDEDAIIDVLERYCGNGRNPEPSWGEVKYEGKYVVGPGSQLDGCDKDWCDRCSDTDGGYYRIADDVPIATLTAEDVDEVLAADPELSTPDTTLPASEQFDLPPEDDGARGEGGDYAEYDEFLTRDDIRDALTHVDPDCGHTKWRNIGFALGDFFDDRDTALAIYREWSSGDMSDDHRGEQWDADAQKLAPDIIDRAHAARGQDGEDDETVGIGTVIHHAKNGGWDMPSPPRSAGGSDGPADGDGNAGGEGVTVETPVDWSDVRAAYALSRSDGRLAATNYLDVTHSWMFILETETLWVYDPDRGRFAPWGETTAANILERNLQRSYSRTDRAEIIDRLKARNQTHRDALNGGDHPEPLLCVGNGVVDLATGELREHDPAYLFTRGVEWDYGADHADREPILRFLDDITERTEDRDTLLDHLAHGLMPGHPYRAFVMMYGPGSNGKTQFGQIVRGFVGTENAASVDLPEITQGEFATGALPGKFVNFGDENSVSEIRDATDLKSLTGGGTMRANEKHEKQFDFENEAAMFFAANEPPRITEEKDAIADRLYPINMPYQFKGESEYDPENPLHRRKVTGIADDLLSNDAAMCGLLDLCVEHAKRLIETDGQYSMPEGPAERRLMYEAASDPLARFVLKCLESGDPKDVVLKDDAYAVYKTLCEADDERVMKEDTFKTKLTQQAAVDVENTRVRWLTPGDSRDRGWRHVRFSEGATDYMNDRLRWRYFPDDERVEPGVGAGDTDGVDDDADDPGAERDVFGALPIARAATTLTGYITVTVQLVNVDAIGDTNGVRAIAKDTSGAIDVVAWDPPYTSRLKDLAGEHVVIENAEVTEYEGKRQLSPIDGLTEIDTIQAGVGHTAGPNAPDGQADLSSSGGAEADGGTVVPDDAEGTTADARRLRTLFEPDAGEESIAMTLAEAVQKGADRFGMTEVEAMDAIIKMQDTGMIYKADDGFRLA